MEWFLVDAPLAFGDGEKARCPAYEELSHIPHGFRLFPQVALTVTNVDQQNSEHNSPESKFYEGT